LSRRKPDEEHADAEDPRCFTVVGRGPVDPKIAAGPFIGRTILQGYLDRARDAEVVWLLPLDRIVREWMEFYNHRRPYKALGSRSPAVVCSLRFEAPQPDQQEQIKA
jgi:transposase InsO family protein